MKTKPIQPRQDMSSLLGFFVRQEHGVAAGCLDVRWLDDFIVSAVFRERELRAISLLFFVRVVPGKRL
jgi:hypothetical protein